LGKTITVHFCSIAVDSEAMNFAPGGVRVHGSSRRGRNDLCGRLTTSISLRARPMKNAHRCAAQEKRNNEKMSPST